MQVLRPDEGRAESPDEGGVEDVWRAPLGSGGSDPMRLTAAEKNRQPIDKLRIIS